MLVSTGSLVALGSLAGCTSLIGSSDDTTDSNASTESSGSYTGSMSPMGEVTFERPPTTIFTRLTHLAGMAFALGRGNDVNAMHAPEYYNDLWNQYVARLDGVELDWSGLYSSWEPSKEKLYELDSDVHLADPASVLALKNWSQSDLDEIESNVAPWFGNALSDRNRRPPETYSGEYTHYGLWELFEKVAQIFQAQQRYDALAAIHQEMLDTFEAKLPPESDRPTVAMLSSADLEEIYAYPVDAPGFLTAHMRPLGAVNAYPDDISTSDTIDAEQLLAADPDVICYLGGMTPGTDIAAGRDRMRDDPVMGKIPAVKNDRVYAQGARYQGPILNLFQLEMTAKQLYPDQFGEWPGYESGPYPEIPAGEQLFDRGRVGTIINGSF